MRVSMRVWGTAAVALFAAVVPGFAQAPAPPSLQTTPLLPPPPGFVPPYEIMRTVRAAGFDPLAPPLREGTTYVLRATDFRGILMRVVVDARSGAIRDANRIVQNPDISGAAFDGQLGMASPYESSPDIMPPPYGRPPQFDTPATVSATPPPVLQPPATRRSTRAAPPPLPRPRPAELAAQKSRPPEINAEAKPGAAAAAAPVVVPGKAPLPPPIND